MPATTKNQGYAFNKPASLARIERIIKLLETPMTKAELAAAAAISERGITSYVHHLLTERPRRIHIHDWRPNSPGSPTMVLIAGNGTNKRRPPRMTPSERSLKRRKDPEVCLQQLMYKRAARRTPRRDALSAAMFGEA